MLEDAVSETLCLSTIGMLQVGGLMLDNSLSVCDSMLALTDGNIDEQQHPSAPDQWFVHVFWNIRVRIPIIGPNGVGGTKDKRWLAGPLSLSSLVRATF